VALSALSVFVASGVIAAVIYFVERERIAEDLRTQQEIQARNFAAVCAEAFSIPGAETILASYLRILKSPKNPDVVYAYFLDTSLSPPIIRLHSDPRYVYAQEEAWLENRPIDSEIIERFESVIVPGQGQPVGKAVVGFSRSHFNQVLAKQRRIVTRKIFQTAGAVGLVVMFLSFMMALTMTRPIRVLAEGVRVVGMGNFQHKVPVQTGDEIGDLAKSFNQMAEQLLVLDRMKDDFVNSVTHELRSPLTAIGGYVKYLLKEKRDPLTDGQRERLRTVQKNTIRLGHFIDDVLDLAKIEAMEMNCEMADVSVRPVADDVVDLLNVNAEEKEIALKNEVPEDLPLVRADPERLQQILTNLVSNALKFTPVRGAVAIKGKMGDPAWVCFSVEDNGAGIPEDQIGQVFDKFRQVRQKKPEAAKGPRETTKGTGLGLAIVKGIVEAHDGKIWVESELGKGTTFFVCLPKASAKDKT